MTNVVSLAVFRAEKAESELRKVQRLYSVGMAEHEDSMAAYKKWRKADVLAQGELFAP